MNQMTLSLYEINNILNDPNTLLMLMSCEDLNQTYSSSVCEPDEILPWPTERYMWLFERGRSIIMEDIEIWDTRIREKFGIYL